MILLPVMDSTLPPPPYGQQVGGTHPTGMLSCLAVLLKRNCPIGVIVL